MTRQLQINGKAALFALMLRVPSTYGSEAMAEQALAAPDATRAHVASLYLADLERVFWICDHAATTQGLSATPTELCSAAYDELKERKFSGDFFLLMAWWQQNKSVEYRKLEELRP